MASSFTTNIGIERPALGDYVNTWSTPVNADWTLIDQALGSTTAITGLTNADTTLTVAQSAYFLFVVSGTLTGNVKIIFPATIGGRKVICNNCTGAFTLTICNGAGDTGVVVPQSVTTAILLNASAAALDATASYANLPQLAANTVVGNAGGSPATAAALTKTQLTTLINAFTSSLSGAVPASSGGLLNFLRADGTFAPLASSLTSPMPQGRLTLISGTPVLSTSSGAGVSTIYYTPYLGQLGPNWNGTNFIPAIIPELSLSISGLAAGSVYDVFYWNNSGTMTLVCGPAWTNATTRSAGTAVARVQGILVNSVSISGGPSAGYGIYIGTIATDAGGATVTFNPQPASAAGGPTNGAWVGLWNQYNRVNLCASEQDSTSSWAYAVATWRAANGSSNNRITFVSGQAEDCVSTFYQNTMNASNAQGFIGLYLDATNGSSSSAEAQINGVGLVPGFVSLSISPQIGRHFIQATEIATANSVTYYGGTLMNLSAQLRY